MRRIFLVALVMMFPWTTMAVAEDDVAITVTPEIWSQYLGSGGSVLYDEPVAQIDVFVAFPKGVGILPAGTYIDIWGSAGLDDNDTSSEYGDEVDLSIGWKGPIEKLGNGVVAELEVAYYDCNKVGTTPKGDFFQIQAGLSKTYGAFTPYIIGKLCFPTGVADPEGNLRVHMGVNHCLQLAEKVSLSHSPELVYDNGSYGRDQEWLARYCASLDVALSENITLSAIKIKFSTPITDIPESDGRKTELVWGSGFSIAF